MWRPIDFLKKEYGGPKMLKFAHWLNKAVGIESGFWIVTEK